MNAVQCIGNTNDSIKMIYCAVLCGESHIAKKDIKLTNWPLKNDMNQNGQLYDSLVNNIHSPSAYFVHDDSRIYPMFLIHFNKMKK